MFGHLLPSAGCQWKTHKTSEIANCFKQISLVQLKK